MAAEIEKWLCGELAKLSLDEETIRYVKSIDDICDQRDYIVFLIESDSKKKDFLKEWQLHYRDNSSSHNIQVYQKQRFDNDSTKKIKDKNKQSPVSGQSNSTHTNVFQEKPEPHFSLQNGLPPNQFKSNSLEIGIGAKKKTKFVSLYSKEGQAKTVIQLPGRHVCECQAAKHKLINNCIKCGRIVCEQEGAGPCVFCGSLVCTPEDQEIIDRGSKKGMKLSKWLMKSSGQPATNQDESSQSAIDSAIYKDGFEQALQHRNKLLEYDKNSVRRTQVIDDECDYFATESNQWLSEEEKNKLRKQEDTLRQARHGSKRDRQITFDFAGRKIIDAEDDVAKKMYDLQSSAVQELHYESTSNDKKSREELCNPAFDKPVYEDVNAPSKQRIAKTAKCSTSHRIQDKELQEMSDLGLCLSMHQPWASLLVAGIKKDEGRTWYTAHRGRLWIASTVKTPSADEIFEMENLYSHIYKGQTLQFPKNYPTGSLLGCVNVEDCLSQEEYRDQYPDGESNSPFVFICTNPQELLIKFPIKGKHKIYKLDQNVHQAAKKGLR